MPEKITKTIIVKGSVEKIYNLWSDFKKFPEYIPEIISVIQTGEGTNLWTARGPSGEDISWESVTTRKDKYSRIAWKTIIGEIKISGQVSFLQLPMEETQITVLIEYLLSDKTPGLTYLKQIDPNKKLLETLRAFKNYAETVPVPGD